MFSVPWEGGGGGGGRTGNGIRNSGDFDRINIWLNCLLDISTSFAQRSLKLDILLYCDTFQGDRTDPYPLIKEMFSADLSRFIKIVYYRAYRFSFTILLLASFEKNKTDRNLPITAHF